jgi:hypothetical protein
LRITNSLPELTVLLFWVIDVPRYWRALFWPEYKLLVDDRHFYYANGISLGKRCAKNKKTWGKKAHIPALVRSCGSSIYPGLCGAAEIFYHFPDMDGEIASTYAKAFTRIFVTT